MGTSPPTRPSLLLRLRDPRDGEAWAQFVRLYAPVVYGYAVKNGFQDADAVDLTQDVLVAIGGAIARLDYDRTRGSFRGWLFTLVRNRMNDARRAAARRPQGSGDTAVQVFLEQHAAGAADPEWDREYERQLFRWAAEQVRPRVKPTTWDAFWLTAVDGVPVPDVAARLGLTVAAVYLARSRVTARLRETIEHAGEQNLNPANDPFRRGLDDDHDRRP